MYEILPLLPIPFWLTVGALIFFGLQAWSLRESTIGIPMLMVLFTTSVWYFGDVLYNDYTELFRTIGPSALQNAWWEVLLFVCVFGLATPSLHHSFNRKYLLKRSNVLYLYRHGIANAGKIQAQLNSICLFLALVWTIMMIIALFRTKFDFQGIFMPYLGTKADPWPRGRVGGGYDSLMALAIYILIGLTAAFGVLTAITANLSTRILALTIYLLAIPSYVFDRTRNVMLATLLPGFLAWVFLRIRASLVIRIAILAMGFLVLESWLKFVIENRSVNSIARAFHETNGGTSDNKLAKHEGLNMFEELGHINSFITDGTYRPNWGARYFAELVNPIPRVIWHGKPLIGIDYAVARGMDYGNVDAKEGGVAASISTGMIGQGVVNFGRILGPIAAALLMALWASILARQDLLLAQTGRVFLYSIGLLLTFNMGRDITLIVLYPFVFGYGLVLLAPILSSSFRSQESEAATPPIGTVNPNSARGFVSPSARR